MSPLANAAQALPSHRLRDARDAHLAPTKRPALGLVRGRPAAARAPFVALVAGLLSAGLVALLLLNTALASGAFQIRALQEENNALTERQQQLDAHIQAAEEPAALAVAAQQQGLVAPAVAGVLDLRFGTASAPPVASQPAAAGPAPARPTKPTKPTDPGAETE